MENRNPEFTSEVAEGVRALRLGQHQKARGYFARVVRRYPQNATAWFWLSRAVEDEAQRQECLAHVRALDEAKTALPAANSAHTGPRTPSHLHCIRAPAAHTCTASAARCPRRDAGGTVHVFPSVPIANPGHVVRATHPPHPPAPPAPRRNAGAGVHSAVPGNARNDYVPQRSAALDPRQEPAGMTAHGQVARALSARISLTKKSRLRKGQVVSLIAFLVVVACIAAPLIHWRPAQAATEGTPIQASGLIYADQMLLSSEYGGRISSLPVREGAPVTAGQIVVQLDTSLIDAEIAVAQATVDLAQAGLDRARAGVRPGQVETAEAQLAQAQAAQVAAMQAVSDTLELVENPQEILLQISVLRAQAQAAEHKLSSALALKDAAEIGKDRFYEARSALQKAGGPGERRIRAKLAEGTLPEIRDRLPPDVRARLPSVDGIYTLGSFEIEVHSGTYTVYRWVTVNLNLPFEAHLAPNLWWQAWIGVNATAAERDGIEAALAQLYDQYAQPIELQAQADQAVAALIQAEAQVALAQSQLDGLKAGATEEQLGTFEAQVAQARAALDALLLKKDQMQVRAPIDGIVVDLVVHEGEVAARGATLVTLANLDKVTLEVYLPETQIGLVHLGHTVQVRVDSFDRDFEGTVSHIADSAQFTPRNVATKEERVNLVFAIQIDLDNEEGALKPGMPADATFE